MAATPPPAARGASAPPDFSRRHTAWYDASGDSDDDENAGAPSPQLSALLASTVATTGLRNWLRRATASTLNAEPLHEIDDSWTLERWLASVRQPDTVHAVLAEAVLQGAGDDTVGAQNHLALLRRLGSLGEDDGRNAVRQLLVDGQAIDKLVDALWPSIADLSLAPTGPTEAEELHSRFVHSGLGFELKYGDLHTFFGGLERIVGAPNPQVLDEVVAEHRERADADVVFATDNYRLHTTSRIELQFVAFPEGVDELAALRAPGLIYCDDGTAAFPAEEPSTIRGQVEARQPLSPAHFNDVRNRINHQLSALRQPDFEVEEFLGARLYTGPMYMKYNACLRGLQAFGIEQFRSDFIRLCCDAATADAHAAGSCTFAEAKARANTYKTTLHVLNSAIVKLSKLTVARKVYRGVAGGYLPATFLAPNEYGVRGGIDVAFMSTTLDKDVALRYAAQSGTERPGVCFCIQQGMVDRGADISWLSQYPHEQEVLFAPLAGLEVQRIEVERAVLVVDVRLSINLASATIENVVGRNFKTLKDICENMIRPQVKSKLSSSPFEEVAIVMLDAELERKPLSKGRVTGARGRRMEGTWYNRDDKFKRAVDEILRIKQDVLNDETRLLWMARAPGGQLRQHFGAIVALIADDASDLSTRTAAVQALLTLFETDAHPADVEAIRDLYQSGDGVEEVQLCRSVLLSHLETADDGQAHLDYIQSCFFMPPETKMTFSARSTAIRACALKAITCLGVAAQEYLAVHCQYSISQKLKESPMFRNHCTQVLPCLQPEVQAQLAPMLVETLSDPYRAHRCLDAFSVLSADVKAAQADSIFAHLRTTGRENADQLHDFALRAALELEASSILAHHEVVTECMKRESGGEYVGRLNRAAMDVLAKLEWAQLSMSAQKSIIECLGQGSAESRAVIVERLVREEIGTIDAHAPALERLLRRLPMREHASTMQHVMAAMDTLNIEVLSVHRKTLELVGSLEDMRPSQQAQMLLAKLNGYDMAESVRQLGAGR